MTDDLISRQAAIDALDEQIALCDNALKSIGISMKDEYAVKVEKASLTAFRERLKYLYLPPAQPEPCEDVVSRKAVKDGFVEMCNLICPYTEKQRHAMCGSCLLGTAFDVLEATQPVTPKQRWIPVTERLPEKNGAYLITAEGFPVSIKFYSADSYGWGEEWRRVITAWMPLPNPWEGDAE